MHPVTLVAALLLLTASAPSVRAAPAAPIVPAATSGSRPVRRMRRSRRAPPTISATPMAANGR